MHTKNSTDFGDGYYEDEQELMVMRLPALMTATATAAGPNQLAWMMVSLVMMTLWMN